MTHEQLQQIQSALVLAFNTSYSEHTSEIFAQSIAILDAALAKPVQEPVAWSHPDFDFAVMGKAPVNPPIEEWTPLFKHTAPVSREWQSLTEEMKTTIKERLKGWGDTRLIAEVFTAIEAALKEKNHG